MEIPQISIVYSGDVLCLICGVVALMNVFTCHVELYLQILKYNMSKLP